MSAEVWLGALQLCLQPSVILFLCIGVCIGTVIGALPGLSATMGIAIMTPITFWFEPADGFAMLMGLWNAAIFAGGISAILVNTPGTPASICQAFDGYSLYRQGKGGLALGVNGAGAGGPEGQPGLGPRPAYRAAGEGAGDSRRDCCC